jgi:hypothetical protein
LQEDLDVLLFTYGKQRRLSFGSPLLIADEQEYRFTVPVRKTDARRFRPYKRIGGKAASEWAQRYEEPIRAEILRLSGNLVFDARMAMFSDATLATSSRLASCGYRILAGRTLGTPDLGAWEKLRSLKIPVLNRLGASDVLRLRETAAVALPAFRLRLRSELFSLEQSGDDHEEKTAVAAANRLQQEAVQLHSQLAAVTLPASSRREAGLLTLSAVIALVGMSSGQPALALGGTASLASMLMAAHNNATAREKVHAEVSRQPAAILLSAQRLTAHGKAQP